MKSQKISCCWVLALLCYITLTACVEKIKTTKNITQPKTEIINEPLENSIAKKNSIAERTNDTKWHSVLNTNQAKDVVKATSPMNQELDIEKKPVSNKAVNQTNDIIGSLSPMRHELDKEKKQDSNTVAQVHDNEKNQVVKPQETVKTEKVVNTLKRRKRSYIALKSNIPFQALCIHNLAVEVQVHEHITVDLPVMWSVSDIERDHAVRGIALQPEVRWWLKKAGRGHFGGIHTHIAWFNLKWESIRYQADNRPLFGAGISYGYKFPLSSHWEAEFNIGAGYVNMKYDTFYNIENGAQIDTRDRHYWGITRAGISLVYRF